MIRTLQKMGGIAALIQAATCVVGVALMFTLPGFAEDVEPIQRVAFLADNEAIMYMANLFVYVVAGVFLVVLALAVYERLKAGSPRGVRAPRRLSGGWLEGSMSRSVWLVSFRARRANAGRQAAVPPLTPRWRGGAER
jgi:hypothetical protein